MNWIKMSFRNHWCLEPDLVLFPHPMPITSWTHLFSDAISPGRVPQSSPCPPSPVVLYLRMSQGSRPHPSSSFLPMPRCLCASPLLILLYKVYHPRARPLGAHSSFAQSSIYLSFRTPKALSCPLCASFLQDSRICFCFCFWHPAFPQLGRQSLPLSFPSPCGPGQLLPILQILAQRSRLQRSPHCSQPLRQAVSSCRTPIWHPAFL